jgi:hypothetical protein
MKREKAGAHTTISVRIAKVGGKKLPPKAIGLNDFDHDDFNFSSLIHDETDDDDDDDDDDDEFEGEDEEEGKLESFNSFVRKRK